MIWCTYYLSGVVNAAKKARTKFGAKLRRTNTIAESSGTMYSRIIV